MVASPSASVVAVAWLALGNPDDAVVRTVTVLVIASASQAASSPVGSPFGSASYVHGPPNTQ